VHGDEMMERAQEHQVGQAGGTALGAGDDVVRLAALMIIRRAARSPRARLVASPSPGWAGMAGAKALAVAQG
jgi:hypothetical protein